jgi:hypothetical protein
MNDEIMLMVIGRVVLFQPQPTGTGPFFRLAALSIARVVVLHVAISALPAKKMASGSSIH